MASTICLNMIVKNEAPVIRRCLESVRPLIDSWVIVDTGSTDGTQELIREALADIPGELHEQPWVDFAHNRTEALELARGRAEYILVIDADEVIEREAGFVMPPLTADVYTFTVHYGGCTYTRKQLLRDAKPWRYEGAVHEYLTCAESYSEGGLPGLTTIPRHDGARARDPLTYRRDALLLEKSLLDDPENTRTVFYLAQSYRDAGDAEMAIRWYQRRAQMKGWDEEVWYSLYQIAQLKERMQTPWPDVMEAYLAAHQFRPDRAGPLYRIAMHYMAKREHDVAHIFLSRAMAIPPPAPSRLFVESALYDYQIAIEYAVTSFYARDYKASIETHNALLRGGKLPAEVVDQVIRNRRYAVDALMPRSDDAPRDPGVIRVIVVFRDPGPEIDDCIESLLQQELDSWEAVFIDDGSALDHTARIPDDPHFRLIRHEGSRGVDACLAEYLRDADPDLLVLPLTPADHFADANALATIRAAFADPKCRLAYGQFRTASGQLGDAEPPASAEDLRCSASPVAFRGAAPPQGRAVAGATALQTRFLDAVLTIRSDSQTRPRITPTSSSTTPMISCLMVTLDRLSLAKRAVHSFADQTYPNRELVIVTDGTPRFREALERHVAACGIDHVRFVYPQPGLSLGALRNISLAEAQGEIVCQWDDDDCSHPDRLRMQCADMLQRNARASFMTDHLQFIADQRLLCWIDWTLGGTRGTARLAPGTLMMFNDPRFRYPEAGLHATRGEDSVLLEQIHAAVPVAELSGAGHLYLYQYHGRNTFSREHHLHLTNYRTASAHLQTRSETLREAIRHYPLARPVIVVGREGPVFAIA